MEANRTSKEASKTTHHKMERSTGMVYFISSKFHDQSTMLFFHFYLWLLVVDHNFVWGCSEFLWRSALQEIDKNGKLFLFFVEQKKHSPSKNVLSLHRWVWAYDSLEKILSLMRFFAWLKAKCCSTHARSYSSIYKLIKIIFIITMLYCNTSIYYVNLHICLLFWEKLEPEIVESNFTY